MNSYHEIILEAQRVGLLRPTERDASEAIRLDSLRTQLLSEGHIHKSLQLVETCEALGMQCNVSEYIEYVQSRVNDSSKEKFTLLLEVADCFIMVDDVNLQNVLDIAINASADHPSIQAALRLTQRYRHIKQSSGRCSKCPANELKDMASIFQSNGDYKRLLQIMRLQLKELEPAGSSAEQLRTEISKVAYSVGDGDTIELQRLETLSKGLAVQDPAFVLETCETFLKAYPFPLYQSLISRKLLQVYREMHDLPKAIEQAEIFLRYSTAMDDQENVELAKTELEQLLLLHEAVSQPPNSLARRKAQERIGAAFSQLSNLPWSGNQSNLFMAAVHSSKDVQSGFGDKSQLEEYLKMADKAAEDMHDVERDMQLLVNECTRASLATAELDPNPSKVIESWRKVLHRLELLPAVEQANFRTLRGRCHYNIGGALGVQAIRATMATRSTEVNQEAVEINQTAIMELGEALKYLQDTGDLLHLGLANFQMGMSINCLCLQLRTIDPVPILDYFAEAIALLEDYRDEMWMFSLADKHRVGDIVESWRGTYDASREAVAILAFCSDYDTDPTEDYPPQAWVWVQRSKSASLAELLGSGTERLTSVDEDSLSLQSAKIFREWKNLGNQLVGAAPEHLPGIRQHIKLLKQEMRKQPDIRVMLAARRGDVSLEDLDDCLKGQQNVLWVDWIFSDGAIFLFTARSPSELRDSSERRITMTRLSINIQIVERWMRRNLQSNTLDSPEAEKSLSALQGLVQPLETLARTGDTLVFCPTKNLYRIPLHALRLKDQPIIEQFLVVYAHSLGVFRYSHLGQRQKHADQGSQVFIFGNPSNDRSEAEESAKELAGIVQDADVSLQSAASNAHFRDSANRATFLYFNGHTLGSEDPLADGLVFSDGVFTAEDALHLRFETSPHIGLIACASSRQKFPAVADEPFGILPAFILAGASSVLATLWPIDSKSGRIFSSSFYKTLLEPNTANSPVHLAQSFQNAVRKMRRSPATSNLYHWAGFVLYGSWAPISVSTK